MFTYQQLCFIESSASVKNKIKYRIYKCFLIFLNKLSCRTIILFKHSFLETETYYAKFGSVYKILSYVKLV